MNTCGFVIARLARNRRSDPGSPVVSYLMQLSGSLSQSVLHRNLSQCSQPIVGVSARPLSNASAAGLIKTTRARAHATMYILTVKRDTFHSTVTTVCVCVFKPSYFLVLNSYSPPPPPWKSDGILDQ